ncbi:hypothetical protein FA95DRAFT_1208844 [Auriscalpium vulgare]|uniref:Uncharacterized protein n=1 Tax=Auriscalpium vulgare TaxID=40419 RepID=A0ACB8RUD9_9AGAM|nr:hypothetical protein FA95DRAFT_1208844 [Auriscalpium vulgare]
MPASRCMYVIVAPVLVSFRPAATTHLSPRHCRCHPALQNALVCPTPRKGIPSSNDISWPASACHRHDARPPPSHRASMLEACSSSAAVARYSYAHVSSSGRVAISGI